MIAVLQQLGVTWKDVFLAGVAVGLWLNGRNRRHTGERIGAIEDHVAELRGVMTAIGSNDEKRR